MLITIPTEAFERLTVSQMVTLIDLHKIGLAHELAKLRGRDLSSVTKQLDTINATFLDLCGERLVETETGRGKPVQFTRTGEVIVDVLERFLQESLITIDKQRRETGRRLTAASTTGMLSVISQIWPKWQQAARGAFELRLDQIRTAEVADYLNSGRVDLVFAGTIEGSHTKREFPEFEFLEWSKGQKVILLSNHTRLPSDPVRPSDITDGQVAIIIPSRGIIRDFVDMTYGTDIQRMNIVAVIDDVYFGLGLLRNQIYQASMFAVEPLADRVIAENNESMVAFHKFPILGDATRVTSGVFRRRDSRNFSADHPINVCWKIIEEQSARRSEYSEVMK